jgi:acetyl-CoA carboxylase carboxyl transferase subunit beta
MDRDTAGERGKFGYVCGALGATLLEVWDDALGSRDPIGFPGYVRVLAGLGGRAAVASGLVEFDGSALAALEFDFDVLGGSMGAVEGEKIVRAFDRARVRRLPILAIVRTGGARMQEGMASLVQMARTTDALVRHAEAGLMSLALLRSPTTGGVFVSWASLADLRAVEAGATIGFGGPRVVEQATGRLPHGSHNADSARRHGLVDAVVEDSDHARRWVCAALGLTNSPLQLPRDRPLVPAATSAQPRRRERSAMQVVETARQATRPSGLEWAAALTTSWTEIAGAGCGVRSGLATLGRTRVVVIAMDRHATTLKEARLTTADYKLARRAVDMAGRWGLPLLTIVDTAGADPSSASENAGIAYEIAALFRAMSAAPVPTMSLCVGEGGSGGAMAFSHVDAFWMLEDAFYSVIAPEGAATILWRDASRAHEAAGYLALTASRVLELGVIDRIVRISDGAALVASMIESELQQLQVGRRASRLDRVTAAAIIDQRAPGP